MNNERWIQADWLYSVTQPPLANGLVHIAADGTILEVLPPENIPSAAISSIEKYQGLLCPGLINTHCHLELSHLQGLIPEGKGMVNFIKSIIQQRGKHSEKEQLSAMYAAQEQMKNAGIVAVGDISNQGLSATVKAQNQLYYHTFIELMGFNPAMAVPIMAQSTAVQQAFAALPHSVVPHAPYSVSAELMALIKDFPSPLYCIHNQESEAENQFFEDKKGDFVDLYQFLGVNIEHFTATGKSSLQNYAQHLSPKKPSLMVHNTFSKADDIAAAQNSHPALYWCLCPSANLYIENALPRLPLLQQQNVKITLGTDSLASNAQLSILEEMRVLQHHFGTSFADLLQMATLNGAEFLQIQSQYGSLEKGKNPGLLLLQIDKDLRIDENTEVKRLVNC